MRRAQPLQDLVTHHARRTVGCAERAFRLHRVSPVVLDASNERRACFEDLSIEFVIEITAVDDVQASRLQHGPKLIGFRGRGVGNRGVQGNPTEDVEVQVQFDRSMLRVLPQGPSHARKGAKDTAVHGGEMKQLLSLRTVDNRRGLARQFLEDLVQSLGVKQPRGFAERTQRRRPNPQSSLNGLESRSLLQGTQAGYRGTKEVKQQEANVMVVEQLSVARPITLGAEVPGPRQQGNERVEILQALDVTRLQGSSTLFGHCCLSAIPETLRVRREATRKSHANSLAQISCRTVLGGDARG